MRTDGSNDIPVCTIAHRLRLVPELVARRNEIAPSRPATAPTVRSTSLRRWRRSRSRRSRTTRRTTSRATGRRTAKRIALVREPAASAPAGVRREREDRWHAPRGDRRTRGRLHDPHRRPAPVPGDRRREGLRPSRCTATNNSLLVSRLAHVSIDLYSVSTGGGGFTRLTEDGRDLQRRRSREVRARHRVVRRGSASRGASGPILRTHVRDLNDGAARGRHARRRPAADRGRGGHGQDHHARRARRAPHRAGRSARADPAAHVQPPRRARDALARRAPSRAPRHRAGRGAARSTRWPTGCCGCTDGRSALGPTSRCSTRPTPPT